MECSDTGAAASEGGFLRVPFTSADLEPCAFLSLLPNASCPDPGYYANLTLLYLQVAFPGTKVPTMIYIVYLQTCSF